MYKQFLSYVDGKSFLHKLDPRTKIICLMILSIIIFNTYRMWSLLSLLALFLLVAVLARVSVKKLFLSVKPMLFFIGIVFLLHFLFAPAPVFSDISMSIQIVDNQIHQLDRHFMFSATEIDDQGNLRLKYYEPISTVQYVAFENMTEGEDFILIEPSSTALSGAIVENPHFEIGSFSVARLSLEDVPAEKLENYSLEVIYSETDPAHQIYLGTPVFYQVQITPTTGFLISPSTYSLMTGLGVALKFILLILFASLLAATTKQSAMVQGIERLVRPIPLKWANITSQDLALMVLLTVRFIPLLISTSGQIKSATYSRAFNASKHPFRAIKIVSTGLINSIIRFADDVSRAMQNRGYTGIGKTSMNELKFTRRDGVFFGVFLFVMLAIIITVGWLQMSIQTFL